MANLVERALAIAEELHKGQKDLSGVPYINHPKKVASMVNGEYAKAVALLHDTIEDCGIDENYLLERDIPLEVVEAVKILSKPKYMPYFDYIQIVKTNELARIVKLADLEHNSDLSRLWKVTEKDLKRAKKYEKAIKMLSED